METKDLEIILNVDAARIDLFGKKAYRLAEIANEAKTLANDLASLAEDLGINVSINS